MTAQIEHGTSVEVRDVNGTWHPATAVSAPFVNCKFLPPSTRNPWWVVAIEGLGYNHPVNWPLEDVRAAGETT